MPAPAPPENRSLLLGPDGKPAPNWQQWFTRIWRNLVPADFFYIPSRDGAPVSPPTGTAPEERAGFAPLVFDHTNSDLYIYRHSDDTWIKVTLS